MRKFILVFLFIVGLIFSFNIDFSAATKTSAKDNTGKSTYTPTEITEESIYGMYHQIAKGTAITGSGNNGKDGQYINEFEMKTDGVTSKLVTWAVMKDNTTFVRRNIITAAKDYEAKNPGWIVVGGINADQYWFKYGDQLGVDGSAFYEPSPYYPMVSNGDKLFTVTPYMNSTSVIGFTNDGSVNSMVHSTGQGGYYLSVIDAAGTVQAKFELNGVNKPAGSGTSVWCYHFDTGFEYKTIEQAIPQTTNSLYVVEDSEIAFMSMEESMSYSKGFNTLFCKGYISNDSSSSFTLGKGQFAIETADPNVKAALKNGVRIKVEQFFKNDEMNNCTEAVGYHTIHRENGIDNLATGSYDANRYSRSLFGKKADGTYVLITADMVSAVGSYGLNWTECNAVAEYYGVTDMYQMDGGGSVTAMARTENGGFKVTNYPKDSGNPNIPRDDFSYLFFVVRDPGVQCLDENITYHSVKLTKREVTGTAEISNIKVKLNDKTYDFNGNELLIDGLSEQTTYNLDITYDIKDGGVTTKGSYSQKFTTKEYIFPKDIMEVTAQSKTFLKFKLVDKPYMSNVSNITLVVGDNSYQLKAGDTTITAENLIESTEYECYVKYDIYDEESKTTFHGTTEVFKTNTLSYDLPTITAFEESRKKDDTLSISYTYKDVDGIVKEAYIELNGVRKLDLTGKSNIVKIENIDFENSDNTFKLVLVIEVDGKTFKVESEPLKYEKEKKEDNPPLDPPSQPEPPAPSKKKCGKKSMELVITLVSIVTLFSFVLRKRD